MEDSRLLPGEQIMLPLYTRTKSNSVAPFSEYIGKL